MDIKNSNVADDKNNTNTNISTKYFVVDNRNIAFTRLSLPFLQPSFSHQKCFGNPNALGTLFALSHCEHT